MPRLLTSDRSGGRCFLFFFNEIERLNASLYGLGVCLFECDMLANGGGRWGLGFCGGCGGGWGGERGLAFFFFFFPRLSPASKWSVYPPPLPSLRAAGPRSGNKTKKKTG